MGEILKKYKCCVHKHSPQCLSCHFARVMEIPDSFSVLRSGVIRDLDLNRMLAEEFSLCL